MWERFSDLFQLASIGVFLLIFTARAAHLLLVRKINPIAVGRGKKGFALVFELIAFSGLIAWMAALVLRTTALSTIVESRLNPPLFDSTIARGVGMAMVALAMLLFAFAFLSFGNSWRVGFDR